MKQKTKLIEIQAPLFPGFYNTILSEGYHDHDSEVDHFKERGLISENVGYNDVDFIYDYAKYQRDICESYTSVLAEYLAGTDLATDIEYSDMTSPSYYNFSTDRLFIRGDFNMARIKQVIASNLESFQKFLKDNYTSYDGYISFIDNDSDNFIAELDALKPEYITVALTFCMLELYDGRESIDFDLQINAIDGIHLSMYLDSVEVLDSDGNWTKLDI